MADENLVSGGGVNDDKKLAGMIESAVRERVG